MTLNDPLANALSLISNQEKMAKQECMIRPQSGIIRKVLGILSDKLYLGECKVVEDGRGGHLIVSLLGRINRCGAIKPRYPLKVTDYEKFEKRYLPARGFGILIVSTSKGIMTHDEAKEKKLGGSLLAYCY